MDINNLIKQCQQGDSNSFATLFEQYGIKALRTAYLITGQKELAEDVVQEAFIQCFREIRHLRRSEAFNSWFYHMLVRISWRISSKEKQKVSLEDIEDTYGESIADFNLINIVEANETQAELRKAVESLSIPLRTVIILHYYNSFSIKEISKILKCFEGTVKSRLHNARKQLGKEYGKFLFDNESYEVQGKENSLNAKAI